MGFNREDVRQQAERELKQERFRKAVERYKERMQARRWWHRLFPYTVIITRRDT